MMPAANRAGNMGGVAKAHRRQGLQCFGIVLDPGKNQIAMAVGQFRLAFEQPGIMALHGFQHRGQGVCETPRSPS